MYVIKKHECGMDLFLAGISVNPCDPKLCADPDLVVEWQILLSVDSLDDLRDEVLCFVDKHDVFILLAFLHAMTSDFADCEIVSLD